MRAWNTEAWGNILTIRNGKNQKHVTDPKGLYPIYGSGGIMGYANDYLCEAGTTIIGRKGSINNPIYVSSRFWNVDTAFGLCPGEQLDNCFFYYFCFNYNFFKHNKATTIPSLTKTDLLRIKISYPPLPIQKKIAEILDAADSLRQKDQQLIEHYNSLSQSLYLDMFGDPAYNHKNWNIVELGRHIEYLGDIGSNGSNAMVAKNLVMVDSEDYALMIRTVNLNSNDFSKKVKYISKETYNFFAKSKIYGGEIIMNKIGSAGKFWMMPKLNRPVSLGLNQFVIRLKNLNSLFLYHYLSTQYLKLKIESRTRGAVTKSITKSAVKTLPLMYPSIELQNQFAEHIKSIEAQKQQAQASLKKSTELFNGLLQKAFKGELTQD